MATKQVSSPPEEAMEALVPKEAPKDTKRLASKQSSGMESSVFRFHNVNFTVGEGEKQQHLLKEFETLKVTG